MVLNKQACYLALADDHAFYDRYYSRIFANYVENCYSSKLPFDKNLYYQQFIIISKYQKQITNLPNRLNSKIDNNVQKWDKWRTVLKTIPPEVEEVMRNQEFFKFDVKGHPNIEEDLENSNILQPR
jgi:hypothetical protein